MKHLRTAPLLLLALLTSATSCDQVEDFTSFVADIGAEGGLLDLGGEALVEIPAGALSEARTLGAELLDLGAVNALPTQGLSGTLGPVLALTPHGQTFEQPIQVDMAWEGADENTIVYRLADGEDDAWEVVPGATAEDGRVVFETREFSYYRLGAAANCPCWGDLATLRAWALQSPSVGYGDSIQPVFDTWGRRTGDRGHASLSTTDQGSASYSVGFGRWGDDGIHRLSANCSAPLSLAGSTPSGCTQMPSNRPGEPGTVRCDSEAADACVDQMRAINAERQVPLAVTFGGDRPQDFGFLGEQLELRLTVGGRELRPVLTSPRETILGVFDGGAAWTLEIVEQPDTQTCTLDASSGNLPMDTTTQAQATVAVNCVTQVMPRSCRLLGSYPLGCFGIDHCWLNPADLVCTSCTESTTEADCAATAHCAWDRGVCLGASRCAGG